MGELLDYVKERLSKNDRSETQEMMEKTKVKNSVIEFCDKYLTEAGMSLEFEVAQKDLNHIVTVISEEPLRSKYDIVQISPTMFSASLKVLEI